MSSMTPTSTSSGNTPASAATGTGANAHHPTRARPGADAGADLFSSLLSLLASTTGPAGSALEGAIAADTRPDADPRSADAPSDNPLAGLLATLPGWTPAAMVTGESANAARGTPHRLDTPDPATAKAAAADGATPLTAEAKALLQPLEPGAARERGMEPRPERSAALDKVRHAMAGATAALTADQRGTGRGTELAPGIAWVRAGGASETAAQALATSRPTVALDERFAGTPAPSWSAVARREFSIDDDIRPGEPVGPRHGSAHASAGEATLAIGAAGGAGSTGTGDGLGGDSGQEARRDDAGQPLGPNADETEVTHWGAGHVRHASLRVGGDGQDAIDIRLQVQGQEVQIGFATDDAHTRELLREQAPQVLGELLQRSGVELGSVSVGAQGQQGQQAGSDASPTRAQGIERPGGSGRTDAGIAPAAPQRPRTDGSRPLDVFA